MLAYKDCDEISYLYTSASEAGDYFQVLFQIKEEKRRKMNKIKLLSIMLVTALFSALIYRFALGQEQNEDNIPKIEDRVVKEIKKNGVGGRLVIKEIMPSDGDPFRFTFIQNAPNSITDVSEFPEDYNAVSTYWDDKGRPKLIIPDGSILRFYGNVPASGLGDFGFAGYKFIGEGEKLNRLTFVCIKDIGFVYARGKGKVISPDGKEIKLGY